MSFMRFLLILLIITLCVITAGFVLLSQGLEHAKLAHKMVGMGTLTLFFIIMPAFIIARYSKKDLSNFTFNLRTKEDDDDEDWGDEEKR